MTTHYKAAAVIGYLLTVTISRGASLCRRCKHTCFAVIRQPWWWVIQLRRPQRLDWLVWCGRVCLHWDFAGEVVAAKRGYILPELQLCRRQQWQSTNHAVKNVTLLGQLTTRNNRKQIKSTQQPLTVVRLSLIYLCLCVGASVGVGGTTHKCKWTKWSWLDAVWRKFMCFSFFLFFFIKYLFGQQTFKPCSAEVEERG